MKEKRREEDCEPRLQICREDTGATKRRPKSAHGQGIQKDQRGQEQPADKERAQKNR